MNPMALPTRKTLRRTKNKALPAKRPPGRQPLELDLVTIEDLAGRGLTHAQIADSLGISERSLFNHKNRDDDVREAIRRGQARGVSVVASALMDQVRKGNVTAQIFFLKCRGGWTETQRVELTTPWEEAMRKLDEEERGDVV
jgi:hypothetical protein